MSTRRELITLLGVRLPRGHSQRTRSRANGCDALA